MAELALAAVNGEWMNDWFESGAEPAAFTERFRRDGVDCSTDEAASRLGGMIRDLDAEIVALVEAPSRSTKLDLFVDRYLRGDGDDWRFHLGDTGGAQKIALLYRGGASSLRLAPSTELQALIEPWMADVDGNGELDEYSFTRTPLVARAVVGGTRLEVVAAHLKSNFINGGRAMWENPATRPEFIRASLRNRRRIATEAMHIRTYVERRLDADHAAAVVVLGDLNDGPGQDHFEERYLAHNATDVVLGSPYRPERLFRDAPSDVAADLRFSVVFDDFVAGEDEKAILLDHILLSPGLVDPTSALTVVPSSGAVEHDAWRARLGTQPRRRDHRATDHRPITVRLRHS